MEELPLWLIRPRPYPDESLSSWIVRIAWHNVEKLESFTSKHWGARSQLWSRDIDRVADPNVYELVARKIGIDPQRVWGTTLASYEGILFERHSPRGQLPWLTNFGGRQRERFRFGLQCCPDCLREDAEPYFRRRWRLAFVTYCSTHRRMLIDACDYCQSPIAFHLSDFGLATPPERLEMTICGNCGRDYRAILAESQEPFIGDCILHFQALADLALGSGWTSLPGYGEVLALAFFEGARQLVRPIASNAYCLPLREEITKRMGVPFRPTEYAYRIDVESLRTRARTEVFSMLGWLMQAWPTRFIACAIDAGISSSYFSLYRTTLPYWLAMPMQWHLDRTWYKPNPDEIRSVVCYLEKHGHSTSHNNVRKWLGRWYVSRHMKEKPLPLDG